MPGERPLQGMIQTIISLRQLQLQEAAQQLQQQQIGISQGNLDLARGAAPLQGIAGLQGVLQRTDNPAAFSPYAPQIAQQTGMPADFVTQIMNQTPAATGTTQARAVQSGAAAAGGSLNANAAAVNLAGAQPGEINRDRLLQSIFGQAGDVYSTMEPAAREGFLRGVIQRQGTGQSLSDAAEDLAVEDFLKRADAADAANKTPNATKDQIVKIGKGLAPNASSDAQIRLGWANYRQNERQLQTTSALEQLRTRASLENARATLDAKAFEETNNILAHRNDLLNTMSRTGATATPEGIRAYAEQLNAFNAQLRNAAPTIYGTYRDAQGNVVVAPGYLHDIPIDATLTPSGIFDYLSGRLRQPK